MYFLSVAVYIYFLFSAVVSTIYGSFFQSSLSHTGCFRRLLSNEVPRKALVRGKCPSGAFLTS